MAGKRAERRRGGRKHDPNARRHATTRRGRRGEDDRDYGSAWLRAKKLRTTSRDDIELTAAGVLFGRGLIDRYQYDTLGQISRLLQQISRSFGRDASPAGLWAALLAAGSRTPPGALAIVGDQGARRALERTLRRLDGS